MRFSSPLVEGRLIRRYKRFLTDVELTDGEVVTAHCPNTGSLMGCLEPGSPVWLSRSANHRRRYAHTWELVRVPEGTLVGVNTARSNALVAEALQAELIPELSGYASVRREVVMGGSRSRVDFVLEAPGRRRCFLEVKNVTAAVADGTALFPDAVSSRAVRHLDELAARVREGHRAALCFCVQRDDVRCVRAATEIDPDYARALRRAQAAGVELTAWAASVTEAAVALYRRLEVAPGAS